MSICQYKNCTKDIPSTRRKGSKYCSPSCSNLENTRKSKQRQRDKRPLKICAFCKTRDVPKEKHRCCKYCSDECNSSAINARINRHRKPKIIKIKAIKKEVAKKKKNDINPFYLKRNT